MNGSSPGGFPRPPMHPLISFRATTALSMHTAYSAGRLFNLYAWWHRANRLRGSPARGASCIVCQCREVRKEARVVLLLQLSAAWSLASHPRPFLMERSDLFTLAIRWVVFTEWASAPPPRNLGAQRRLLSLFPLARLLCGECMYLGLGM